jgi:RNA polymerase sigma-70 factor (ECF subfamily)
VGSAHPTNYLPREMTAASQSDSLLTRRIRSGESEAWNDLIARFEGRLLAYIESRTRNRAAAEDVVQETFIGFLTSLPNFDSRRPLEGYLFSIAAHKLIDFLRREGRRPTLPLAPTSTDASSWEPPGDARPASSILRSGERRGLEETALVAAMSDQIGRWRKRADWQKIECVELLFLRGWANKDVAARMGISEQAVANHKFEFLARLRAAIRGQDLPEDVFPELYEED